jgi:hypothetical protein
MLGITLTGGRMPVDLLGLLERFEPVADWETPVARFRTNVPAVAPLAYMGILFARPKAQVVAAVDRELGLPGEVKEFFGEWNGARLFVGALVVFGCVEEDLSEDMRNVLVALPFSIGDANRALAPERREKGMVAVGRYEGDGSVVCVDRATGGVVCYEGREGLKVRQVWAGFEHWLVSEVMRLSALHDKRGNLLVDKAQLLPGHVAPVVH